jgi:hypothetical protein
MSCPLRWWAGALLLTIGCNPPTETSPEPTGSDVVSEPDDHVIPGALVSGTWPVRMADDAQRAPYEQSPGWASLVMQRDYPAALEGFGGISHLAVGQARVHLELAAVYRQAVRIGANSTIQIYGENRREEDPPQVDCMVAVSRALLGDREGGKKHMKVCSSGGEQALNEHALSWVRSERWPPEQALALSPGQPGEPAVGAMPGMGTTPHWVARDLVEGLDVPLATPAALVGLALFHEQAALAALPEASAALAALLDPWRLPAEPLSEPTSPLAVPEELLFGSPLLVPADVDFLQAVAAGDGAQAVAQWKDRSVLAASIQPCVSAEPASVEVPCVVERAGRAFDQVRGAMEIVSGGEAGYHRPFAEMVRLGVIRAGEAVADSISDEDAAALLRINALDLSIGSSAEPHYLLSIAAWDAGNRNSLRASDILHAQVGHIPGVEVARFPLDALHVRLSRESAPGVPMH